MEREMSVVNITDFKSTMDFVLHLNDQSDIRIPMLVHGMHALGKTEVIRQIAEENGYNCVTLNLSTMDVSDLLGIPYRDVKYYTQDGAGTRKYLTEDQYNKVINNLDDGLDAQSRSTTRFATPDWLSDALDDERPCIFFLDEMNRAPLYVLQTMLPFVLEGRLHTHNIRENDIVIGAVNPDTSDYNVEAIGDKALLSRFAHFYFEPEVSEWIQYISKKNLHPAIIEAVNSAPEIFNNESIGESAKVKIIPDRRNMFKAGVILNHTEKTHDQSGALFTLLSAMLGEDMSTSLCTLFKTKSKLSPENILDGSIFKAGLTYANDLDRIKVINEALIGVIVNGEGSIWELNKETPTNFHNQQATYANFLLNKKELKNVQKWLSLCPIDAQMGFIKQLRVQLIDRYKSDEDPNKGAYIAMAVIVNIDPNIVDKVFPD
jgi:MoxR-like ATPase